MTTTSLTSGQTSSGITVSGGEWLEVLSGGATSNVVLSGIVLPNLMSSGVEGASLYVLETVSAGGSARGTGVGSDGYLDVAGGTVSGTMISAGDAEIVSSGGEATSTLVSASGVQDVYGGTASHTVVGDGGYQLLSGGAAFATVIRDSGAQIVLTGTVSGTVISDGGEQVTSSGTIIDTVVSSGGAQFALGGTVSGTVVDIGGTQDVPGVLGFSAGVVYSTMVSGGGEQIASGGSICATVLDSGANQTVVGGQPSATVVGSGAVQLIEAGEADGTIVKSGGYQEVDGGTAATTTIDGGGLEIVRTDGDNSSGVVGSGAIELVLSAGSDYSTTVQSGGLLVFAANASASFTDKLAGGTVISGSAIALDTPAGASAWAATTSGLQVGGGDVLLVLKGGTVTGTEVSAGGSAFVEVGGKASDTVLRAGGSETVHSGGATFSTTISGGALSLGQGGGDIDGAVAHGGVMFASVAGGLLSIAISGGASVAGAISGFAVGDTIDLSDVGFTPGDTPTLNPSSAGQLRITEGGNNYALQLSTSQSYAGDKFRATTDGAFGTDITIACFAEGTCIATPRGNVAVEDLRAGDSVVTQSGLPRPVVWLGHRRLDCRRHPRPQDVWPVRVRAHAFAAGRPARDLLLSPDHAVLLKGALIPIRYLINGATVAQIEAQAITYWHVELPTHDVLLAEGLPAESYLDTGNRGAFANGGPVAHMRPDFARRVWQARSCAPLVLRGPRLVAAKRRLLAQAAALGHATTDSPGLKVVVNGSTVPSRFDGDRWRARLPQATQSVRLTSRVWIPARMQPHADDTRPLRVAVSRLWLDKRAVSLESPGLSAGWHVPEHGWRWTNGDAELALTGVRELAFAVAMTGTYWQSEKLSAVRAT